MEAVAQNDRAFRPTYLYRLVCEMCVPVCMYWLAGRVRMDSFLTNYVCVPLLAVSPSLAPRAKTKQAGK